MTASSRDFPYRLRSDPRRQLLPKLTFMSATFHLIPVNVAILRLASDREAG